jgi:hypothetical protein
VQILVSHQKLRLSTEINGGNAKLFKMHSGKKMYCLVKRLMSDKIKATERILTKRVFVESRQFP